MTSRARRLSSSTSDIQTAPGPRVLPPSPQVFLFQEKGFSVVVVVVSGRPTGVHTSACAHHTTSACEHHTTSACFLENSFWWPGARCPNTR